MTKVKNLSDYIRQSLYRAVVVVVELVLYVHGQ